MASSGPQAAALPRPVRAAGSLFVAAAVLVGLVGPAPATAATQLTTTENINVRKYPGKTGAIIGSLPRGRIVTAIRTRNGWSKIKFATSYAYVSSQYLKKRSTVSLTGAIRVTTAALNMRSGPSRSYRVVAVVPNGRAVTLTGRTTSSFVEAWGGRRKGWVSRQYLSRSSSRLPRIVGTRTAITPLRVRSAPTSRHTTVGLIRKGKSVAVTGATLNGRAQIIYRSRGRWVTARYLANPVANRPTLPRLPRVRGYRYATTALNIRSNSSTKYTLITEVPRGTRLAVTGVLRNGRAQVVFNRAVRWVTARYLARSRPVARSTPRYPVERGLKPGAIKVHRALRAAFPQITTYMGVRPDPIPDHPSGRALDAMIPRYRSAAGTSLGGRAAAWARANASRLGIEYVIWNQRIWNVRRSKEGWRYMASRGSDSANHRDHVHISVER